MVLDGKAAQNLAILLAGSMKHMTYDEIRLAVLRCDESVLTSSLVDQMIQYVPTADELKKLEVHKENYEQLQGAEQFAITVRKGCG